MKICNCACCTLSRQARKAHGLDLPENRVAGFFDVIEDLTDACKSLRKENVELNRKLFEKTKKLAKYEGGLP